MKTTEDFIKTLITIDFIEQSNCYGHYPFQLFAERKDGQNELNALALGGDVVSCYSRFKKYYDEGAKKIFMSLDFPAGGDIENDFVVVFSLLENQIIAVAIPYNCKTGERYPVIKESNLLLTIIKEFKNFISEK